MTDWLLSVLWYGSFLAAALGLLALLKPIRRLGLSSKSRGAALVGGALVLIVANGTLTPAAESIAAPATALDRITPTYQFREVHVRSILAPPSRVLLAIKSVTADEIALFRTFTTIRRLGQPGPESILNAPERQPILDVATRSGFLLLADTDREVVVGSIVAAPHGFGAGLTSVNAEWFQQVSDPGVVKATMNFLVEPESAERSRVTTETRVFATDQAGARRFTPYWRTIFPGSWILRASWLNAIAKRAEG